MIKYLFALIIIFLVAIFIAVGCSENSKKEEETSYDYDWDYPAFAFHSEYVLGGGSNTVVIGDDLPDNYTIDQTVVYNDGFSEERHGWIFSTDSGLILYTEVYKDYSRIESWRDKITMQTADSIKCFRYNQAKDIIDQIKFINDIDCEKEYLNLY